MEKIKAHVKKLTENKAVVTGIFVVIGIALAVVVITRVIQNSSESKHINTISTVAAMQPQKVGEFNYSFESLNWEFTQDTSTAAGGQTKVAFTFNNFSRREPAFFAKFFVPFFVGYYDGGCSETNALPKNVPVPFLDSTECSEGPLLAVAMCGNEEDPTWVTISQCNTNLVVSETAAEGWNTVRTIDMTTLVN